MITVPWLLALSMAALQAPPEGPVASALGLPEHVRVGLATDLEEIRAVCCTNGARLVSGSRVLARNGAAVIRPAKKASDLGVYRLQVGALKDAGLARLLVQRLRSLSGHPTDRVFDAQSDLYKVRVGEFESRAGAQDFRSRLKRYGLQEAWIVHEDRGLAEAGLRVETAGGVAKVLGRWLSVVHDSEVIAFDGRRYRGRLLIYLNDRGKLNVVNELYFEDYLRGVVPIELGPELYPELEALKAQAVAARTYSLHSLGSFYQEGYDICSTPRCQVYQGLDAEHPLSDQAIRETQGELVVFRGMPAETLYSATCGGHTEQVSTVFPDKHGDHLQGVRCLEGGLTSFGKSRASDKTLEAAVLSRLLPAAGPWGASSLVARIRGLAGKAGVVSPPGSLHSLARSEVRRFMVAAFDLVLDSKLLSSPSSLERLLDDSTLAPAERELAAEWLDWTTKRKPTGDVSEREADRALVSLAKIAGVVEEKHAHLRELRSGRLTVRLEAGEASLELPDDTAAFREPTPGTPAKNAPVELAPGDALDVFVAGNVVLALVQSLDSARSKVGAPIRAGWTRFRSVADLRRATEERYPGFDFETFEVLDRGVSGRVATVRLMGAGGKRFELGGLAIRWLFDLPDTQFVVGHAEAPGRGPGWWFRGRGRGHGVGMCQVGAFGMARRGLGYRQILQHYYSGVSIRAGDISRQGSREAVEGGAR